MVNILSSEHNQRNRAFEYLVHEQFEAIPGGREALLAEIGQKAIELTPVIDNYFLPDIKNGEIIKPKDFNLTKSEKTPLIPVLKSDSKLRIRQGDIDLIRPTPSQYKNSNTPDYGFSFAQLNHLSDEVDGNIDLFRRKLRTKQIGGAVLSQMITTGNHTSFYRPILMMSDQKTKRQSEKSKIETLDTFMHETTHVNQALQLDPYSDLTTLINRELEAYTMSVDTSIEASKLLGIDGYDWMRDKHSSNLEFLKKEYIKQCITSGGKYNAEGFQDWYHNEFLKSDTSEIEDVLWLQ